MNGKLTHTFKDEAERDNALRLMGLAALHLRDNGHETTASELSEVAHSMIAGMELHTCPFCQQDRPTAAAATQGA